MSHDYAHACERAELLGLPLPTEEEWEESQRAAEAKRANDAGNDDAAMQKLEHEGESAQRVSGGLDELNTILHTTQKELNRFKTVCGSLSSMLKVIVRRGSTPNHKADPKATEENKSPEKSDQEKEAANEETLTVELTGNEAENGNPTTSPAENATSAKKADLNEKMGSHLDKLDSLVTKAENAQYSMKHQSKQMKKFLK